MADTPAASSKPLFKKKKKKKGALQASGGSAGDSTGSTPRQSSKSLLSFDHDEEADTEVFVVKKQPKKKPSGLSVSTKRSESNDSGKANKAVKPSTAPATAETQQTKHDALRTASSGMYSADYLNQLRSKQQNMPRQPTGEQVIITDPGDADEDAGGEFPSADMVKLARERRKLARERGVNVPLDMPKQATAARRVPDDIEDDFHRSKMSFGEAARRRTSLDRKQEVKTALDSASTVVSTDPEVSRWEQGQMSMGRGSIMQRHLQQQVDQQVASGYAVGTAGARATGGPTPQAQPDALAIPPASDMLERLRRQLRDTLTHLKEAHQSHKTHNERVKADMESSQENVPRLEHELQDASGRYNFFQEIRGYVRDLLACLNEKVPELERCESRLHQAMKTAADARIAAHNACHSTLRHVFANAMAGVKVPHSEQAVLRSCMITLRQARERRANGSSGNASFSLIPEEEGSKIDATEKRASFEALQEGRNLLDDVVDEFSDIKHIVGHFETWKFKYPHEYSEAFISQTIPKVLKPLISHQLLTWNPLAADCQDFEDMSWFNDLMFYGCRDDAELSEDDPDSQLVPTLVEQCLVPKLAGIAEFVWDPFSAQQTQRISQLLRRLIEEYPTINESSEKTRTLLTAVKARLIRAADSLNLPSYSSSFRRNNTDADDFVRFCTSRAVELISVAAGFDGIMTTNAVQGIVFGNVMANRLLPFLTNSVDSPDNLDICEQALASIPDSWFKVSGASLMALRMTVEPLVSHLISIAGTLKQAQANGAPVPSGLIGRIAALLNRLNEQDAARAL